MSGARKGGAAQECEVFVDGLAPSGDGLATIDGLEMLIGQAALAFELFFGAAPPEGGDEALRQRLVG